MVLGHLRDTTSHLHDRLAPQPPSLSQNCFRMEVGKTCLDGIGGGAGEGDQVDRVEATSSFPVESRSCSELPGTWGEGEVGGGLVQSEDNGKSVYISWVL